MWPVTVVVPGTLVSLPTPLVHLLATPGCASCSSFGTGVGGLQGLLWSVEATAPQPGRVPVPPVASWASQDTVLGRACFPDIPEAPGFWPGRVAAVCSA